MADEDEEDQGTVVTLRYGPMWLGGKLRYSLTRIQALRQFLLSRSLGVKLIQLPVSLVEGMLVVEPTNINRLEVLVEKQTLRIVPDVKRLPPAFDLNNEDYKACYQALVATLGPI